MGNRVLFTAGGTLAAFALVVACSSSYDSAEEDRKRAESAADAAAASAAAAADAAAAAAAAADGGPKDCTCVAKAPTGWLGPYARSMGKSATACGGAFDKPAFAGKDEKTAPGVTCSACACGSPAISCSLTGTLYGGDGCSTECGKSVDGSAPGTCVGVPAYQSAQTGCISYASARSMNYVANGGYSCPAVGGLKSAAAEDASVVRLCEQSAAPTGGGCAAAEACVAPRPPGFDAPLCVLSAITGDVACPAGTPFTQKVVTYETYEDNRSCSACSCTTDKPTYCADAMFSYADSACGTDPQPFADYVKGCRQGPPGVRFAKQVVDPAAATCTPHGGQVTGAITFSGAKTICCTL